MNYLEKTLKFKSIEEVLFLDIETSSIEKEIDEKSPYWAAWEHKMRWDEKITKESELKFRYTERAPIYKEFGKIVAISYGRVKDGVFRAKRVFHEEEKDIIEEFFNDVSLFFAGGIRFLGVFSGRQFDIPFIEARASVNGVQVEDRFDTGGMKPWEIKHIIDVQEILRSGSSTSISLLGACAMYGLPSPKTLMSGEDVNSIYWGSKRKKRLEDISEYAMADAHATCNLLCKRLGVPITVLEDTTGGKKEKIQKLPPLERLYNTNSFSQDIQEDLKQIFSKKKMTKKEKTILEDIVNKVYSRTNFIDGDQDTKAVKEAKLEEVKEFFENL